MVLAGRVMGLRGDRRGRGPGLEEVVSSSDLFDAVGEFCGVRLEFPAAWMTITSGETLTWDIVRKEARPQEERQDA